MEFPRLLVVTGKCFDKPSGNSISTRSFGKIPCLPLLQSVGISHVETPFHPYLLIGVTILEYVLVRISRLILNVFNISPPHHN